MRTVSGLPFVLTALLMRQLVPFIAAKHLASLLEAASSDSGRATLFNRMAGHSNHTIQSNSSPHPTICHDLMPLARLPRGGESASRVAEPSSQQNQRLQMELECAHNLVMMKYGCSVHRNIIQQKISAIQRSQSYLQPESPVRWYVFYGVAQLSTSPTIRAWWCHPQGHSSCYIPEVQQSILLRSQMKHHFKAPNLEVCSCASGGFGAQQSLDK